MVSCRAQYKRNGIACDQPLTGVGKNKRTFLAAQDSPSICHQCSRMCMPADASSLSRLHLESKVHYKISTWQAGTAATCLVWRRLLDHFIPRAGRRQIFVLQCKEIMPSRQVQ